MDEFSEPHGVAGEDVTLEDKGKGRAEEQDMSGTSERGGIVEDAGEEAQLNYLAGVQDQDDLERDIGRQADQMLTEQADERDSKRMHKTQAEKQKHVNQIKKLEERLAGPGTLNMKAKIRADITEAKERIAALDVEVEQIEARILERHTNGSGPQVPTEAGGNQQQPNESRRDFLIRTGKITPFSRMAQVPRVSDNLADVMLDAETGEQIMSDGDDHEAMAETSTGPVSHRNLLKPGFIDEDTSEPSSVAEFPVDRPAKRRRVQASKGAHDSSGIESSTSAESDDAFEPEMDDKQLAALDDTDDGVEGEEDDDFDMTTPGRKRKAPPKSRKPAKFKDTDAHEQEDLAGVDDGSEDVYQARLESWVKRRSEARRKARERQADADHSMHANEEMTDADAEEWFQPHPTRPDASFNDGFRIPGDIYPSLFDYQKTGVQWLNELYTQQVGGIIGDEMGLGKTIQVISFLAGLHYSKKITKPVIVVCPATVMKQWVNEFHRWWPPLRVSILHSSGSGMLDVQSENRMEQDLESRHLDRNRKPLTKSEKAAKKILDRVKRDGHVLVTTYSGLQSYAQFLIPTEWEYAVLDEGHKIRNPNAGITIYCKELLTPNRLILSGTPMQNNLTELWSLFDFVFPMRLGTLVDFRNQFEYPIKVGGYANASNLQVETAMRCAETLKETISGYLLQRFKIDVAADLPKKSERVLFCRLTKPQREAYEFFLGSPEMKSIIEGNRQALYGIDILRKICNHPDLPDHKFASRKAYYGSGSKSGKMQVVKGLVEMWKKDGHKTLLFAQHRIMLDILEKFIKGFDGINFMRMDGTTAIKDRQTMVDKFNNDPDQHVFLLTTKVGGLGVNLTGADRVIIYDPDWNPSTDVQARERAWRLGQKREVEIYRLMTAGTIEEKIYHRQIFKQFLTNKILRDPKQRQTFHLKDLHDLFSLGEAEGETETGTLFKGTEVHFSDKKAIAGDQDLPIPPTETHRPAAPPAQPLTALPGISRDEAWKTADDGTQDDQGPANVASATGAKDDRLLNTIFARTGVHSALNHDTIIGGNSQKQKLVADPEIISREARRVANEAARELQRHGETARSVPIGTPTWTGTVGTAGRPEQRGPPSRFGRGGLSAGRGGRGGSAAPSSSAVLANLSARQGRGRGAAPASASSSRAGTPAMPRQLRGREFMTAIRDYLLAHDGQVYTQMLIDHFQHYCGTTQRTEEFKEMLRRIAVLEKGSRGRGKWILKEEFRKKAETA